MQLKTQAAYRQRSSINMTPMIDVVFILLMFFMLSTQFQHFSFIEINASPIDASSLNLNNTVIPIRIDSNGELWIDDKMISLGQIETMIKHELKRSKKLNIRLLNDKNSTVQQSIRLLDRLKALGVTAVDYADSGL